MREYFTFYRPFKENLNGLSDKDKLTMYEAIIDYALDLKEPNLEGFSKLAFDLIRPMLDINIKRWQNGCKGADHGYKGGAPKGNRNATKNNPKTTANQPQNNPKLTPTDKTVKVLEPPTKRFIKPTVQELKEHIAANSIPVDAERFFNYYEANGWKVGRNQMKDWKAALRTWRRQDQQCKPADIGMTLKDNSTDKYNAELW